MVGWFVESGIEGAIKTTTLERMILTHVPVGARQTHTSPAIIRGFVQTRSSGTSGNGVASHDFTTVRPSTLIHTSRRAEPARGIVATIGSWYATKGIPCTIKPIVLPRHFLNFTLSYWHSSYDDGRFVTVAREGSALTGCRRSTRPRGQTLTTCRTCLIHTIGGVGTGTSNVNVARHVAQGAGYVPRLIHGRNNGRIDRV